MYLIEIDGAVSQDVLKNIYTGIEFMHVQAASFILYKVSMPGSASIPAGLKAGAVKVSVASEAVDDTSTDDLIMNLIELNRPVYIRFYDTSEEEQKEILRMCQFYGLEASIYKPIDYPINLSRTTFNEREVIKELMGIPSSATRFYRALFLIRIKVDKEGLAICDGNILADLTKDDFVNCLLYRPQYFATETQREFQYLKFGPDPDIACLYEPWIFIEDEYGNSVSDRIIDYKYRMFQTIKNINPEDYPGIDPVVADILNESGYIRLNDIYHIFNQKGEKAYRAVKR